MNAMPPPRPTLLLGLFFFNDTATTEIYTLSLHDALPIFRYIYRTAPRPRWSHCPRRERSEEHTSELQSRFDLVCRLLLEKKTRIGGTSSRATITRARRSMHCQAA